MKKIFFNLILLTTAIYLFSCAKPEVVNVEVPSDKKLNCIQLEDSISEAQEFKRNAQWEKEKDGANVARMILFWPALATSYANSEKAIKAAEDRTYHLLKIMKDKNCKNIESLKTQINKSSVQNVAGQLKEVRDMYKSGDLTKEEYKKAKKKILD